MKSKLLLVLLILPSAVWAQSVRSFTDEDYRRVLREESRVLFYSVSPAMPLSVEGLQEIRRAAQDLKSRLLIVADPATSAKDVLALGDSGILLQKSAELRKQGIQLHYPSLVVSDKQKIVGAPIAGFKSRTAYVTLITDLLKLRWREEFQVAEQIPLPRRMSSFFKPVYGMDFIASGNSAPNYLLNLRTRDVFDIVPKVDWADPGASPDGLFLTLLGFDGLGWYSIPDILARKPQLLLMDPGLRTYQSMGQLSTSTYRVLGAVSSSTNPAGLIVRDYESRRREDGGSTVASLTEWRALCQGTTISIPMMSKTGRYLSGSYQGTLRVFRIGANAGECVETFDSKIVAGKADFSADDRYLLYVSQSVNPATQSTVETVFLTDLSTKQTKAIYYASDGVQLAFPGFITPDRIVVLEPASSQLTLLERTRVIQD